jgi:hypothetical protein
MVDCINLTQIESGGKFPPFLKGGQGGLNKHLIIPLNLPLEKGEEELVISRLQAVLILTRDQEAIFCSRKRQAAPAQAGKPAPPKAAGTAARPTQLFMIYGCANGCCWPALPPFRDFIGKVPADKVYMGKCQL